MADFFSYIFNIIWNIWTIFLGSWILLGFIVVPLVVIHLLYKHRKNKDEIIKILKPVVAIILIYLLYYLLQRFNGAY